MQFAYYNWRHDAGLATAVISIWLWQEWKCIYDGARLFVCPRDYCIPEAINEFVLHLVCVLSLLWQLKFVFLKRRKLLTLNIQR